MKRWSRRIGKTVSTLLMVFFVGSFCIPVWAAQTAQTSSGAENAPKSSISNGATGSQVISSEPSNEIDGDGQTRDSNQDGTGNKDPNTPAGDEEEGNPEDGNQGGTGTEDPNTPADEEEKDDPEDGDQDGTGDKEPNTPTDGEGEGNPGDGNQDGTGDKEPDTPTDGEGEGNPGDGDQDGTGDKEPNTPTDGEGEDNPEDGNQDGTGDKKPNTPTDGEGEDNPEDDGQDGTETEPPDSNGAGGAESDDNKPDISQVNWTYRIRANGIDITNSFIRNGNTISGTVKNDVSMITVTATTSTVGAKVSVNPNGSVYLYEGYNGNAVQIVVSYNNQSTAYTLAVTRQQGAGVVSEEDDTSSAAASSEEVSSEESVSSEETSSEAVSSEAASSKQPVDSDLKDSNWMIWVTILLFVLGAGGIGYVIYDQFFHGKKKGPGGGGGAQGEASPEEGEEVYDIMNESEQQDSSTDISQPDAAPDEEDVKTTEIQDDWGNYFK